MSEKIKRHTLGTDVSTDVLVYTENDKSNYIGVGKSKNDKYIYIYSSATLSSEYRLIDAEKPMDEFKVFQPRMKNVLYSIIPLADKFLIRTNKDDAKNFKLMECPLNQRNAANWKELIPTRLDVLLQGVEEFKDFIVLNERKDGLVKMRIISLKDHSEHYLNFGEATYSAGFGANPEYNTLSLRYQYTSLTTPASTYDYNMVTKEKKLMKQLENFTVMSSS